MDTIPPNPQQNIDCEHLKLLSMFHYIVSGLTALFACFPIIHLVIGLILIFAPHTLGSGKQQPPAFIGWFFAILASCIILAGWTLAVLILMAGRCIAHRRRYTFCLVMACVECLFMPFGTVLGVFTILALNRQSVKELFTPKPALGKS
jgi:hypothetical protein